MKALEDLIAQIGNMRPDARQELEDTLRQAGALDAFDHWQPQLGPQTEAYFSEADMLLYGGAAGGGKGLPPETPVLTPYGWKAIGKLKVGSAVCATDGTVTRVIGKFDRGQQPLYRLRFSDGSTIVCDGDHIWQAWVCRGSRKIGNARSAGQSGGRKWVTSEICKHYEAGKPRLKIPIVSEPVRFNVAGQLRGAGNFVGRDLPAYVIGVLIGDGSLSNGCARFTTEDPEIAARVSSELDCELGVYRGAEGKTPSYRIPNAYACRSLEELGLLGCRSENKFIPRPYLFAPVEDRFALAQGLMDADGWADLDGDIHYCTVSERLRDDVLHLFRSLGAVVTIRQKQPFYHHNGERRSGQPAYTLRIKMPAPERVFHLERKRRRAVGKTYQSMGLTLEAIEPCGSGNTVCIAVDHPNSLFVTEHFLVTHNTDIICGLSLFAHHRVGIFRQQSGEMQGIVDRMNAILRLSGKGKVSGNPKKWDGPDGKKIEFGHLGLPDAQKSWQGRDHDLKCFDEAAQIAPDKILFVCGWNRTTRPGQRCRIVLASNPPMGGEGDYLLEWFGPWLDPMHPLFGVAAPGELLWANFISEGSDIRSEWFTEPTQVEIDGEMHWVPSRTFIPARMSDNKYLDPAYKAKINAQPEPRRTALLTGDFMAARQDHEWQVIPSDWIEAAFDRYDAGVGADEPMTVIGVDIAQGGKDKTVLQPLHGTRFPANVIRKGVDTKDGADVGGLIIKERRNNALIAVDATGGWAGDTIGFLTREHSIPVEKCIFSAGSNRCAKGSGLKFFNKRAELYWTFMEALNPKSGDNVAIKRSSRVKAQLTAHRWKDRSGQILIEAKEDIKKRVGSSPDEADGIVIAWGFRELATFQRVTRAHSSLFSAPIADPLEDW
ncbi:LAGLIDADG family homing endonuclease [Roseibium algae]|uniref:LAGLIDADG family homing endonuclease n=1 Tax=Roseibium algae TaxID=3123038 RepID=A0ABU8TKB7_9HYPH